MYADAMNGRNGRKPRKNWKKDGNKPTKPAEVKFDLVAEDDMDRRTAAEVAKVVEAERVAKRDDATQSQPVMTEIPQVVASEPVQPEAGRTKTSTSFGDVDEFEDIFRFFNSEPKAQASKYDAFAEEDVPAPPPVVVTPAPASVAASDPVVTPAPVATPAPAPKEEVDWRAEYMKLRQAALEERESAKGVISELRTSLSNADALRREAEDENKTLKTAAEAQNNQLNSLRGEKGRLVQANDELRKSLDEANAKLADRDKDADELKALCDELQQKFSELNQQHAEIVARAESLQNPMFIIGKFSPMLAQVLRNVYEHIDTIEKVVFEDEEDTAE